MSEGGGRWEEEGSGRLEVGGEGGRMVNAWCCTMYWQLDGVYNGMEREREREGRGKGCEILTFNLLNCYFLFLYVFFYCWKL